MCKISTVLAQPFLTNMLTDRLMEPNAIDTPPPTLGWGLKISSV